MGAHSTVRRWGPRTWAGFAVAVVLLLAGTTALLRLTRSGDSPAPDSGGTDVLVMAVRPVGGQAPGGPLTRAGAEAEVQGAADSGAVGVQLTADISWLCSADRHCDTAPLEPVVAKAKQLGLRVWMHVNSTPSWMDPRGTWYAPTGPDADVWAGLFAQLVSRFGTDVSGYEVWNEPNNPDSWMPAPDPARYADLLKACWTAAKRVNPGAQIVGGVLSNNDLGYMSQLDRALEGRGGTAQNRFFYDLLGVHPYAGEQGSGYDPSVPAGRHDIGTNFGVKDMTFRGLERLRAQVHDDEGIWRDVVIGEFGYDTTPGDWYYVPEPRRSQFLTTAFQEAAAWRWVRTFAPYVGDGFRIDGTPSAQSLSRAARALPRSP